MSYRTQVALDVAIESAERAAEMCEDEDDKLMFWRHSQYWLWQAGKLEADKERFLDNLDRKNDENELNWRSQTETEIAEMIGDCYIKQSSDR